ncbi:MAG: EamA family transporter [Desulfovibrionaceae bacterium]|nr:EamA family transporter [Desulfovibrionaceae bacterium]
MWKYYALLAAVCAAFTAIFSKLGVKGLNPDLATAIRVSFILVLVWGIAWASGALRGMRSITGHGLLFLFLSAVATGLSWLFYFRALQAGDVSKVAPIDKLSVPLAMILGFVLLGETVSLKVLAGGALITAGCLLLLL